jgi:ATP-dependent DNA ligase
MLAASAPGPDEALERTGLPAVVDYKLDGVRLQVHRSGEEVRIFTRSLDDITTRLPEVAAVARSLPHDQLVLDGEVLSLRTDGRPEAFQVVASRTMSSADVAGPAQTGHYRYFSSICYTLTDKTCWTYPWPSASITCANCSPKV